MVKEEDERAVKEDQHMLIDEDVISLIADKADIKSSDVVLEIGAGSGNVTAELAKHRERLFVVEKDSDLVSDLAERFGDEKNVSVLAGDVLRIELPKFNKIVSNMPYSILQQFFMRLIKEGRQNFEQAVMVVPYGFAKKMTALPDSEGFGMISALFMAFYDVEEFAQIEKTSFDPQPRVTSVCVSIRPKELSPSQPRKALRLLQELFIHDERKAGNSLMRTLWDKGTDLLGRKVTKKEAEGLAGEILAKLPASLKNKKCMALTNDEFRQLTAALVSWDQKH
jgi:16S rRNA (adenine1518-N6/adenine1519-N6)-dimethyltransferase